MDQTVGESRVVLRCADLSLSFGGIKALDGVGLELQTGRITTLIGPNGAGKTTLLNAINGGVRLDAGSVDLVGTAGKRDAVSLARSGVSRSFQDPQLIDKMSVLDNVQLGVHAVERYPTWYQLLRPLHVLRREREWSKASLEVLDLVGLRNRSAAWAADLPYGPRKLVDIARALVGNPKLVLLDEPSSGLDDRERRSLGEILKSVRDAGKSALLVVEHNMELVREISDDVIGMAAGSVVARGSAEGVLTSDAFRAALTGDSKRPLASGDR